MAQKATSNTLTAMTLAGADLQALGIAGSITVDTPVTFSPTVKNNESNVCGHDLPSLTQRTADYSVFDEPNGDGSEVIINKITQYVSADAVLQALHEQSAAIAACGSGGTFPQPTTTPGPEVDYDVTITHNDVTAAQLPVKDFLANTYNGLARSEGAMPYYVLDLFQASGQYLDETEFYRPTPLLSTDEALALRIATVDGQHLLAATTGSASASPSAS